MRTSTWKDAERKIAKQLGASRNTDAHGVDASNEWLAIEVKHKKALPNWLHSAMKQAEDNVTGGQLPITVLHQHGMVYADSFVVLRLSEFRDRFGE